MKLAVFRLPAATGQGHLPAMGTAVCRPLYEQQLRSGFSIL
jgi:hypothetical protein